MCAAGVAARVLVVGFGWHNGGMSIPTVAGAHGGTLRMSIHDVTRQLNAGLGPTLVAALTGTGTGSCRSVGPGRTARNRARTSGGGCCWPTGCGRRSPRRKPSTWPASDPGGGVPEEEARAVVGGHRQPENLPDLLGEIVGQLPRPALELQ